MHVLHVVQLYRPVPSGAARYFVELGERLVREGHRVTVLTTDAFDLEHLWMPGRRHIAERYDMHGGVHVHRFPIERVPGPPFLYPIIRRLMVEVSHLSRRSPRVIPLLNWLALLTPRLPALHEYLAHSPDLHDVALVHTTNITLDFAIVPVVRWAQQRGIPHLCTPFVHLGEPNDPRIVRYYTMPHHIQLLRESTMVITQTHRERHYLAQAGVPGHVLHTVGVGVTPSDLMGGDAQRFRAQHQIDGDSPIVLTLGVAAADKGTLDVVRAMQRHWAQGSNAIWVQAGPQMEHFTRFCAMLPPTDHTHMRLLGFVTDDVRQDALAAATMLALPSRTDSFGIVYLEAWCYRKPVIGAWAGGVPEVVRHGENGLLVRFGDVDGLAHAIARLLHDHELARAFGEVGHRHVQTRFTWDHVYATVRQIYRRVAGA